MIYISINFFAVSHKNTKDSGDNYIKTFFKMIRLLTTLFYSNFADFLFLVNRDLRNFFTGVDFTSPAFMKLKVTSEYKLLTNPPLIHTIHYHRFPLILSFIFYYQIHL